MNGFPYAYGQFLEVLKVPPFNSKSVLNSSFMTSVHVSSTSSDRVVWGLKGILSVFGLIFL